MLGLQTLGDQEDQDIVEQLVQIGGGPPSQRQTGNNMYTTFESQSRPDENLFSTVNTPRFNQGYESFPMFRVKNNPPFGRNE